MTARRYPLTRELISDFCKLLQAGAYESTAIEAHGIPYEAYRDWMERGRRSRAGKLYAELYHAALRAKSHARLMAEIHMRKEEPRHWLLHGPGKETPQSPGWSAAPRAAADDKSAPTRQLFAEFYEMMMQVRRIVSPNRKLSAAIAKVIAPLEAMKS